MSEDNPMMECGHTANAVDENENPVCVICIGIVKGARKVSKEQPNLEDRRAKCAYCGKTTDSKLTLPFFEYRPKKEFDEYYCGCRGWS